MERSRGIFCRLCFNIVNNEDCTIIDQSAREMLRTVSWNMELVNNHKHVMCSSCSVKLYVAFDFKYTCLYVEDTITSHVNPNVPFVDLKEVYLKEQNNKIIKMEDDQKVCRLCLQLAMEGFVSFQEMKIEMINNYIPEVNFGVTEDPVVCKQCFESLNANEMFIRACLDVETKIRNTNDKIIDFKDSGTFTEHENDEIKLGDEEIKESILKIKKEPEMAEMLIESEEIDIKLEEEERESDSFPCDLHNEAIENKMKCSFEDIGRTTNEYMHKRETETELSMHNGLLDVSSHKSDSTNEVNNHRKYKTVDNYIHHQLIKNHSTHKVPKNVEIYKCDSCSHICNSESLLQAHRQVHQLAQEGPSEIQMYKCETCGFTTKFRQNLELHGLIHKYSPEVQMYKCDICTYETKYKSHLRNHQLTHKVPSKIQMYKCHTCAYESKLKKPLRNHLLTHQTGSKLKLYKCDFCYFQSKYKGCLKTHQLSHKESSEIQVHKHDTDETRSTKHMIRQLTHKGSPKSQM